MAKELEVKVPDIGSYTDVPVIDVLVKAGDKVEKEASLVTLESDKATMDVPAPEAGTVKSIKLKVGDKVSQGDAVLVLELEPAGGKPEAAAAAPPRAEAKQEQAKAEAPKKEEKPAPAKAAAASQLAVTIPDIGDYQGVPVIEVFVKDGDTVEKDAPLLTLESEKATMDVPAPEAGTVRGLKIKVGDKVSKGDAVCALETAGGSGKADAEPQKIPEAREEAKSEAPGTLGQAPQPPPASPLPQPARGEDFIPYASPAIRKFARELGVDLAQVKGSGPRGRITRDDVQSHVKRALSSPAAAARAPGAGGGIPPLPAVDFSQFGPVETKPLARIRKLSAAHLHRSWLNIPHVTQTDEADITELEAFRRSQSEESG